LEGINFGKSGGVWLGNRDVFIDVVIAAVLLIDDVVSFFTNVASDKLNVGLLVLTFRAEDDDATLVSLSPIEYLWCGVGD
jgi:hypothetical protein